MNGWIFHEFSRYGKKKRVQSSLFGSVSGYETPPEEHLNAVWLGWTEWTRTHSKKTGTGTQIKDGILPSIWGYLKTGHLQRWINLSLFFLPCCNLDKCCKMYSCTCSRHLDHVTAKLVHLTKPIAKVLSTLTEHNFLVKNRFKASSSNMNRW